ncbi:SLOG family protein [Streptomyces sp. NPDC001601]|uniref:SLOG family protein n=1 Tax=Streptomyces sp. NPDC001601 TaxID=3364592 RepID=UPI003680FD45
MTLVLEERRVLVCGSRRWPWPATVEMVLDRLLARHGECLVVIEGAAAGADQAAHAGCGRHGFGPGRHRRHPVDWQAERRKRPGRWCMAGPERNTRMLLEENPRLVIAFHDHFSPASGGTSDMCLRGLLQQVPVWLVPGEDVRRGMWLGPGMFPDSQRRRVRSELAAAEGRQGGGRRPGGPGKIPSGRGADAARLRGPCRRGEVRPEMDHQLVVAQNREALEATLKFGERALREPVWTPGAKSQAAAELANNETGRTGPWGEDPPRTAYAAANLLMTGVLDDLGSLRQLLGNPMPVIGPTIVARSAVEIASTAWWLMEPGIGARRRVCRELVLSLKSARRAKQVAQDMEASEAVTDALQQESRVLQRIADLGIGQPTSGNRPVIEGEQATTATDQTAQMLKAVLPPNASAESVYRIYSAVTHGEVYALMNFTAPGVSSNGQTLRHWNLDPDVLDSTVQVAIGAFREAYLRIHQVMDWGKLDRDLWDIKLGKIFSGA